MFYVCNQPLYTCPVGTLNSGQKKRPFITVFNPSPGPKAQFQGLKPFH